MNKERRLRDIDRAKRMWSQHAFSPEFFVQGNEIAWGDCGLCVGAGEEPTPECVCEGYGEAPHVQKGDTSEFVRSHTVPSLLAMADQRDADRMEMHTFLEGLQPHVAEGVCKQIKSPIVIPPVARGAPAIDVDEYLRKRLGIPIFEAWQTAKRRWNGRLSMMLEERDGDSEVA